MTIDLYINEANDYAQDIGDGRAVNLYALLSRVWKNRTASYGLGIK